MGTPASFKPGQSGNPNGRPKRAWTWASLMESAAEEASVTGETQKEVVIKKIFELASKGDMVAAKEILNRMDGMPTQQTDITSGGKPLPQPIYGGDPK